MSEPRAMNTPVKWVAEVSHVREVSLLGTADRDFWKDRLTKENLVLVEKDGKAQLLIVSADMRFMGVRFQEVSFSVLVSGPNVGARRDAFFLVHAFNSCRLFAFWERVFFSTPYYHGDIHLSTAVPCSIQLIKGGHLALRAEMQIDVSSPGREPFCSGEEGWDGPIFLPGRRQGKDGQGKVFFGKLLGYTHRYPFLHTNDLLTIRPSQGNEVLQALVDSHFVAEEWVVREDALHAKSKTYKRSDVFAE
jgi:hypothetical protein